MGVNVGNHYMRGGREESARTSPSTSKVSGGYVDIQTELAPTSACSGTSRGVPNKADSGYQEKRAGRIPAVFSNRGGSAQVSAQMPCKEKLAFTRTVAGISRTIPFPTN